MKYHLSLLLMLAVAGCAQQQKQPSHWSLEGIEGASFADAYRMWRQERETLAAECVSCATCGWSVGVTDPTTGVFTPSRLTALQCRLGMEAHLYEEFLREELIVDADVHLIFESSRHLCDRYGVQSLALVVFVPGHGYIQQPNSGWSPQMRQAEWLEAMDRGPVPNPLPRDWNATKSIKP